MANKMHTIYKDITDEVKDKMRLLDYVFPRRYNLLFTDIAKRLNIDLDPEEVMTDDKLSDKAIEHVERLSNNTIKAIDAMETKDSSKLQEVLAETKVLYGQIEQLKIAVYEDTLTKVSNRRWMEENYLDSTNEVFNKNGVIAMIDLNDFKYINDTFGHITGDKVLFFIALQLKRSEADVVRYGGDEFFVIFDEKISETKARLKLHIIREAVIKKPLNADGQTFKTSFSYGVTEFSIGNNISTIIQLADEEMYSDKVRIKSRLALA